MARKHIHFWSGTACRMTDYFPGVIFILITVFFQLAEPCLPPFIRASVPRDIMVGHVISRVDLARCGTTWLPLTIDDSRFSIQPDGSIVAHHFVKVPAEGSTFSIWFLGQNGIKRKIDVGLSQRTRQVGRKEHKSGSHKRFKRRWSPLPFVIVENDLPPFPKQIELIGSDTSQNYSLYYIISGPGVNEEPKGLFSVDSATGMVSVHRAVDREKYPQFKFTGRAINTQTHTDTDLPLTITVNVQDQNDNTPQFVGPLQFTVVEKSQRGTEVGIINATDADDPKTDHTKIKFTLLSGTDMFIISPVTGQIATRTATLDREQQDKYLVTVEIKDMNGLPSGRANTGTVTIALEDINDNVPIFSKKVYQAEVQENEESGLILRIPVEDKDLKESPNWNSVFKIVKGNENEDFRIETDPKTNEGLLYLNKPLNFEETPNVKLEVVAENESPLVDTTDTWRSAQVDVSVADVDEGPEFVPPVMVRWVKENTPNGTVIGTYTATDPETKSSAGMRYVELTDPASWFKVDGETGDLSVTNTIDRESVFVKKGVYNMTIKATDSSSKSSTGTVVIHVLDDNDNNPIPLARELSLCHTKGKLGSVVVVAEDKDEMPFSAPFTFNLPEEHKDKWTLNRVNGTAVSLQQLKEMANGNYEVAVEMKDQQGHGELQTVLVRVCECRGGKCPPAQKDISLGVWGILALLLGLALLLLLALCCAIKCVKSAGKFHVVDGADSGGMLLKSNTEAPGDAVTSDILVMPSSAVDQSVKGSQGSHIGVINTMNTNTFGTSQPFSPLTSIYQQTHEGQMTENMGAFDRGVYGGGGSASHLVDGPSFKYKDASALTTWNTNRMLLAQKLEYFRNAEEGRYADDLAHSYRFEGQGSHAGTVGCCSEQGAEESLEFLNTLGPKFRNLAEVCSKK